MGIFGLFKTTAGEKPPEEPGLLEQHLRIAAEREVRRATEEALRVKEENSSGAMRGFQVGVDAARYRDERWIDKGKPEEVGCVGYGEL
jgi:hypothetical protein